ncbi:MAG TPA: hypothetical protein VGN16_03960 [Acidobacteriaceae bacterium]|jgi:hypothetical protein
MKTWIWPFSLYAEIRQLQLDKLSLLKQNKALADQLRDEAIANTLALNNATYALCDITERVMADHQRRNRALQEGV